MTDPTHLDAATLARLVAGERPRPPEERHLASCPPCARTLAVTESIRWALANGGEPAPARRLLDRAATLIGRLGASRPHPAALLAAWSPRALGDAPPGIRTAAVSNRQWLFSAGPHEVDVQLFAEGPERARLLGQVLAPDHGVQGLPVHLLSRERGQMALTDRHGEFSLGPVGLVRVRLVLESDDALHEMALDLSEEAS